MHIGASTRKAMVATGIDFPVSDEAYAQLEAFKENELNFVQMVCVCLARMSRVRPRHIAALARRCCEGGPELPGCARPVWDKGPHRGWACVAFATLRRNWTSIQKPST